MLAYISRRLGVTLLILLGVSFTVYVIFAFLPFDPAALTCGKNCNDPGIIELREFVKFVGDCTAESKLVVKLAIIIIIYSL